jgi:hypothetical protein
MKHYMYQKTQEEIVLIINRILEDFIIDFKRNIK